MNDRTRSRRSAITSGMTTVAIDSDDRTEMREVLEALLGPTTDPVLLAGGASKEAWSVDAGGERLLVRRAAGGVIHRHTLSLKDEFDVLTAAYEAGVKVPRPIMYIEDLDQREAFVMERLAGETIGRRIVRMDVPAQLPMQMAEELAKIHAIPPERLPFLQEARLERMVDELDDVGNPHPAIELGLWWLRENRPPHRPSVVNHGDYRIGNLVGDVDEYLERYNELTGLDIRPEELDYWELAGNVGWAIGCLTQAERHLRGQDRSVELAILGRLGAEVEYEICHLLEKVAA